MNACRAQVDHNLFEVLCDKEELIEGLAVYLNSGPAFLTKELVGRTNLGDGALKVEGVDWKRILVPTKRILQKMQKKSAAAFTLVSHRAIREVSKEAKRKDRIAFEESVCDCLGLPKSTATAIFGAVVELVEERHLLPKLRTARKKRRVEQDWEKLREEVIAEVLPNGVKRFPDAFVSAGSKTEWEELSIAAEETKLGETGMGVQEICDGEGAHLMEVRGEEKAKYIVYAKHKGEQIVRVPSSTIVMKKAVQDYELEIREIRDKLYTALMEKCGDHSVSDNMARRICHEFGLPDVL